MKPELNVPYLPEPAYVDFLSGVLSRVAIVQYALPGCHHLDSRIRLDQFETGGYFYEGLRELVGTKKYALLNSRFYAPPLLLDSGKTMRLVQALDRLAEQGILDGLVYTDQYLLQRLSDLAPSLAASLEAVPSVNCMLDTWEKIDALCSYIQDTRFRLPGKIVLDRWLNRDLDRMARLVLQIRNHFPDMTVEVLANEGCLLHCPYKLSHDAYIAQANLSGQDYTCRLNQDLGCMRILSREPYRLLQSPFIRPEDVELYLCHVDSIKLCGRTLGSGFLQRLIRAYLNRSHDGNLLDLLDAPHWLAEHLYIDNSMLSFDFTGMMAMCDHKCDRCGFCMDLFRSVAHPLEPAIRDHRVAVD